MSDLNVRFPSIGSGLARVAIAAIALCCTLMLLATPAFADIDNDDYDGNIFALYAGNGSLVPPHFSLAQSLDQEKPALIVFYLDDSQDCKPYALTISNLQAYYGRAASFIPINVDALPPDADFSPDEAGYYYQGTVPQTVLIDGSGEVVLDRAGQVPFEDIDDEFREVFDLLPRSESVELKRRSAVEENETSQEAT